MKARVSEAKLKINQQAKYIAKLEQKLDIQHTTSNSHRTIEQPSKQSKSVLHSDSPVQQTPTTRSVQDGTREECTTYPGGCRLDKTCPPLFESPTFLITSTPSVRERHQQVVDTPARSISNSSEDKLLQRAETLMERKNPIDAERLETVVELEGDWTERNADSDSTSGDSMDTSLMNDSEAVIIIDGYNDGNSRYVSVEKDELLGSRGEHLVEVGLTNSEEDLVAHAPQTCVSLFGHSIRTSPRPLQLRTTKVRTKKIKYKETEKFANASSSTSSSSTSLERNPQSEVKDEKSPSPLEETDFVSPSSNSPPFLCPTSSPFKTSSSPASFKTSSSPASFKSPPDYGGGVSVSMFPSTPTVPHDTTNTSHEESSFKRLSTSHENVPIPQSDSQFSLDVSQSMSLSPELCGGSFRTSSMNAPIGNDRALSGNGREDLVLANQQGSNERLTKYSSEVHRKDGRLKQTTSNTLFSTPLWKGSKGRANGTTSVDVILKTPSVSHTTVVPVTPGVTTVDKILSRPMDWGASNQTVSSNHKKVEVNDTQGTKRHFLDTEDEEVPVRKKQNLLPYASRTELEAARRLEARRGEQLHPNNMKSESGHMGSNAVGPTISGRGQDNDQEMLVCNVLNRQPMMVVLE